MVQKKVVMEETSEKCVNEDGQRTKTGRHRSHSLLPVLVHLVRYRTHQLLTGNVQNTALPGLGFPQGLDGGEAPLKHERRAPRPGPWERRVLSVHGCGQDV